MRKIFAVAMSLCVIGVAAAAVLPAKAESISFDRNLYYGMRDDADVTALQEFLTEQGVYSGPITGNFLSLTLQAVKKFQAQYGITPVSGYFGPLTRAKANEILASQAQVLAPQVPEEVTAAVPAPVAPTTPTITTELGTLLQARISSISKQVYSLQLLFSKWKKNRPAPTPAPAPAPTPTPAPTSTPPAPTPTPTPAPTSTPPAPAPTPAPTSTPPAPTPTPTPAPTSTPPAPAPTSTPPTPTPTPPPTTTLQWGAYVGDRLTDAATLESLVGKAMNMQAIFVGWGSSDGPFPSEYGSTVRDKGKTLVIFWEQYGTTLDAINAGQFDTYMQQFAAAAKTYGGPVILAPLHEMNGNWDPWDGTVGSNTPAKVIAAWKRIHDAFVNVSNVKFAWDVNNESVPDTTANAIGVYYPGDAYVDYVGVDGFNFSNPWQTFGQVFDSAMNQLKTYNKPIYIFSMACAPGSQKAAWITEGLGTRVKNYPNIAGWVWFNQNKETDWRVNSDSASLEAFKVVIP